MKKTAIALAVAASITSMGSVSAASTEDRLMALEKRLKYLEQRVASQDEVIKEKDQQISELTGGGEGGWFQNVEIGGVVEVEAQRISPDGGPDESDIYVATVELGIAAQINDWTETEVVLLYEDDGDAELDVDAATISIADPDSIWTATAGQYALPFGNFSTNLVSDPITLDAAETVDSAIEFGVANDGLSASAYVFKGDHESEIKNYGVALSYETETDNFAFSGGLGWINDISESDSVVDHVDDGGPSMLNKASAWSAFAQFNSGAFTVIGEYVAATDSLDAYSTTEEPSFYNIEAAYNFDAAGRPATFAVGFQGSDEASAYAGGMDEERTLAAFSMEIMDGTNLAFEYANTEDYAGSDTNTLTGQLAVEF